MGFLTPWFLAGAAAVGLPVWLHLLRKHKTTPLPFSSLMFFERRTQSSIKHRRLRYLVLFALRTAAGRCCWRWRSRTLMCSAGVLRRPAHGRSHRAGYRQFAQHARRRPAGRRPSRWPRRMVAGLRAGAARAGAGVRLARAGHERSHRRPRAAQRRHRCHRALRRAHLVRGAVALAALHRAIASPAARRAPLLGHAADRHAGQLQRSAAECRRAAGAASAGDEGQRPTSPWRTWWRRAACTTAARRACWPPSRVSARPRPRAAFRSR